MSKQLIIHHELQIIVLTILQITHVNNSEANKLPTLHCNIGFLERKLGAPDREESLNSHQIDRVFSSSRNIYIESLHFP